MPGTEGQKGHVGVKQKVKCEVGLELSVKVPVVLRENAKVMWS